jgi:cell division protein FtsI/penicillin-binding protein 2
MTLWNLNENQLKRTQKSTETDYWDRFFMISPLQKSNRLLQIFLGAFLLITFRIWHLTIVQREEKLEEAQKPQRRTIIQQAERGSIVDRFGVPLATNRICYNASIYYSQFTQIPAIVWTTDSAGGRVRTYARKDYIRNLARILGQELAMDPERIEDLIHAKASLFPHVPFILKSPISEQQYYRLRSLEREWLGLHAAIALERTYPQEKTAASVIGHLGAISQKEFLQVADEINQLQQTIAEGGEEDALESRLQELKEKAYTLNDWIGKAGIEKQYESDLRGFYGKKIFEVDRKGNCLRELPGGKEPIAGKTITLSLSAELQQFCETLLIQSEKTRDHASAGLDPQTKERKILKQPYVKGGAIVALDPQSGEVIALASMPRFDPNDFNPVTNREEKMRRIHRWLESDRYIADLWDGKDRLFREGFKQDEERTLTWESYLQQTLPAESPLLALWNRIDDIQAAIQMQEDFEALLYYAGNPDPSILIDLLCPDGHPCMQSAPSPAKAAALEALQNNARDAMPPWRRLEALLKEIPHNQDKLFALDLSRIVVYSPAFTDELIKQVGSIKLFAYRSLTQSLQRAEEEVRSQCQKIFHETQFRSWRGEHQKEFLQQKRREEKETKTYARPYIDYLDQKERELFEEFWQPIRLPLLAALLSQNPSFLPESSRLYLVSLPQSNDWTQLSQASANVSEAQLVQWLKTMRSYRELDRPLWGFYRHVRGQRGKQTERSLAAAFYPKGGFGFSRSHAYQSEAPLGSLFKLVTASAALGQSSFAASPLVLLDEISLDSKDHSLIVASSLDHKPFYRHYKGGRLPRSHLTNIGRVDLLGAIEQSSNPYFAILASDFLSDPDDLLHTAADFGLGERTGIDLPSELKGRLPTDLHTNRTGLYSFAIGQHTLITTPLQAARMLAAIGNGGHLITPTLLLGTQPASHPVALSPAARRILCEGMDRVVWGPKGSARPSVIKGLNGHPDLLRDFLSLQHQMIGKTSTAEICCHPDCNPSSCSYIYKHIWFGAIAFPPAESIKPHKERWDRPELVVVVYLRYGDGGKEAAPIAAQVIHKWREICSRY